MRFSTVINSLYTGRDNAVANHRGLSRGSHGDWPLHCDLLVKHDPRDSRSHFWSSQTARGDTGTRNEEKA